MGTIGTAGAFSSIRPRTRRSATVARSSGDAALADRMRRLLGQSDRYATSGAGFNSRLDDIRPPSCAHGCSSSAGRAARRWRHCRG